VSDTVYRVIIDYELRGDVERPVAKATGKLGELDRAGRSVGSGFEALGSKLTSFGSAAADAFTGAVERVGAFGLAMAGVGAAAALGAISYGALHLNSELEQTNLALAAIFNAQGYTSTFTDAMGLAGDQVAKMKQDVKTLPGDLGQLATIMKTIATPAAQAGMSPDAMRQLSGRAMLVGGIQQLPPDLVARELGQLLAGRAGAHNILGTRLGLIGARGQAFNAEPASKRAADIGKEFDKYGPAAEAFGRSWVANFTTLKDIVKYSLLAPATSPLFESVKRTVVGINKWFDGNQTYVANWADSVGYRLADAFEWGKRTIVEWWPALQSFASDASSRLGRVWHELEPIISRVGGAIKESLANGQALDKLESILKLYIVLKGAQALSPFASVGFSAFGAAFGSGGAGAGAAAGIGGALGAAGLATAGTLMVAGTVAAGGEAMALSDPSSEYHAQAVSGAKELGSWSSKLARDFENLWANMKPGIEWFGTDATYALAHYAEGLHGIAHPMEMAKDLLDVWTDGLRESNTAVGSFSRFLLDLDKDINADRNTRLRITNEPVPEINHPFELSPGMFVKRMGESIHEAQKKLTPKPGAGGGGGGMTIQKLEITLSTNQEPSRIARRIVDIIADVGRHPTASRHTTNFSRARS
jgi:hypothetical protein